MKQHDALGLRCDSSRTIERHCEENNEPRNRADTTDVNPYGYALHKAFVHTECIRPIFNRSQCSTAVWRFGRGERPSAFRANGRDFNVRFGSLADIETCPYDVCFTLNRGHDRRSWHIRFVPEADIPRGELCAITDEKQRGRLGIRRPLSGTRAGTGGTGLVVLQTEPQIYLIAKYSQRVDQERFVLRRDDVLQSLPLQQSGMSPKFFGIFRCLPCARTTSYLACLTSSFPPSGACKRAKPSAPFGSEILSVRIAELHQRINKAPSFACVVDLQLRRNVARSLSRSECLSEHGLFDVLMRKSYFYELSKSD
jgi:hypothetical protein